MNSPRFHNRIIRSIDDPRHQLELEGISWENWKLFDGVKKITGEFGELAIPTPLNVAEVKFTDCKFPDLKFCSNVRKLTFLNFDAHQTYDVTCLRCLKELSLSRTEVLNYQFLESLQKLSITDTESITSVKYFRTIPSLNLSNCPNITDVSWLENCKELTLNGCLGITDVSPLRKVPVLSLSGCSNLVDVSSLGKSKVLNLSHCEQVEDVSALGNVHTLDLSYCPLIKDVSALTNVYQLTMHQFQGLDLSGLTKVVILDITDSDYVTDICMLTHLQSVNITNCFNIHDFMSLYQLRELTAYHPLHVRSGVDTIHNLSVFNGHDAFYTASCKEREEEEHRFDKSLNFFLNSFRKLVSLTLSDALPLEVIPSSFRFLRSLTLVHCNHFDFLPTLPNLGYLLIHNCSGLQFLQITSNEMVRYPIYKIELRNCDFLQEMIINRKIYQLFIVGCSQLKKIECNASVTFMKIDEFDGVELPELIGKSSFVGCCINGMEKPRSEEEEEEEEVQKEKEAKEEKEEKEEEEKKKSLHEKKEVLKEAAGKQHEVEDSKTGPHVEHDKENITNVHHIHAEF